MEYERYFGLILLVVLFTGILDWPMSILSNLIFNAVDKLTMFVDIIGKTIIL